MTDCYDALVQADGATAYWILGGDTLDHSGNGHDAVPAGDPAPAAVAAPFGAGTAYSFYGQTPAVGSYEALISFDEVLPPASVGNWLDVPADLPAGQSGACTWEAWLLMNDLSGQPTLRDSSGVVALRSPSRWLALDDDPGGVGLQGTVPGGIMHAGTFALTTISPDVDLSWHHWAATSYHSGALWHGTLYKDGAPHATWFNIHPWTYAAGATVGNGQMGGLVLLGYGARGWLDGALSHVALYPLALSDCQVLSHYTVALGACSWPQRPVASAQVIGG